MCSVYIRKVASCARVVWRFSMHPRANAASCSSGSCEICTRRAKAPISFRAAMSSRVLQQFMHAPVA